MARRINSVGVIEALADAMCLHGIPEHIGQDGDHLIRVESAIGTASYRIDRWD